MLRHVVLLSGRVSSGKTTLAKALQANFGATSFRTKEFLVAAAPRAAHERATLQRFGARRDKRTGGTWVAEDLAKALAQLRSEPHIAVIDAVRIKGQVDGIRQAYGAIVTHIHLDAPDDALSNRYRERKSDIKEFGTYGEVLRSRTERNVRKLASVADVVIDTDRCTREDVVTRAASYLGLYGSGSERLVDILIGGQYGSEGKGHIASYLAREYHVLVRTGGPNAGHTIYGDPYHAKVHQLPSGIVRNEEAQIVIGPGAVIDTTQMLTEIAEFRVGTDRLSIDPRAMVINGRDRAREGRLVMSIGSTGQGVGAATARRIMGRGNGRTRLAGDIKDLRPYIRETTGVLQDAYAQRKNVLLEGTQGTGLSLYHGEYPYVTSRDTTVSGCLAEAGIPPTRARRTIMICRSYPIRVESPNGGTSGDVGQEIDWNVVSRRSGIEGEEFVRVERTTTTNRQRRVAEFDWRRFRQAVCLNGPTDIALTFADYITIKNRDARRFDQLTGETIPVHP